MVKAISPPSFNARGCLDQFLRRGEGEGLENTPQCYNEIKKPNAYRVKQQNHNAPIQLNNGKKTRQALFQNIIQKSLVKHLQIVKYTL